MVETIEGFQGEYRFLSNFYVGSQTIHVGIFRFLTSEHLYQALKTNITGEVLDIEACPTPGEAKRMGKTLTLREDWDQVKDRAMEICVWRKFTGDPVLLEKLLDTGNALLIESNTWHDNYWGKCTCNHCQGLVKHNKLGQQLMLVRDLVREKTAIDI